jgi:hypothetical protein
MNFVIIFLLVNFNPKVTGSSPVPANKKSLGAQCQGFFVEQNSSSLDVLGDKKDLATALAVARLF